VPTKKKWPADATGVVILDSGAVTNLASHRGKVVSLVRNLVERGWSLVIPMVVLVECLTGDSGRDANTNRFIRVVDHLLVSDETEARLAAELRYRTGNPSVVDALVAAASLRMRGLCIILTTDPDEMYRAPMVRRGNHEDRFEGRRR
jgi:predicted nucleic acid-binding protein